MPIRPKPDASRADDLRLGRESTERHAWRDAVDHLVAADRAEPLEPDDLERLAEAAYWLGRLDDVIGARERAFRGWSQRGEHGRAARVAMDIAKIEFGRHRRAVAQGWFGRAERILSEIPESIEHGYLERLRAVIAFEAKHDHDAALAHAERALAIGTRHGDPDLMAMALQDKGRILVATGRVDEGQALIDEATVAAVGGDLRPYTTGVIYCNTITSCEELADYGRAAEWTEATKRWCDRVAIAGFPGMCRVHRATVMRMRGDWSEAEREARRASEELREFNLDYAAAAFYEIGESRRHAGDLVGAEEAFRQAHELGREPEPGLALIRLAQGDVVGATRGIRRALADPSLPALSRARLLPALVDAAIAGNDLETARTGVDEMRDIAARYGTSALGAEAALASGTLALASGDVEGAVSELRGAWRAWQEIGAPYEAARVRVVLGRAYRAAGEENAARREFEAARSAFERLGAVPDLMTVADLLGGVGVRGAASDNVTRAFLFTDIVGSTPLASALGDAAWSDLMRWHDEALRALIAGHDGEEVDHAGDGLFAAFASAHSAIDCAVAIQRKLAENRRAHGFAPDVRIGVHLAAAAKRGGGYDGLGVHTAARIASLASGGEILASVATVGASPRYPTSPSRTVELKGIAEPIDVVRVEWR